MVEKFTVGPHVERAERYINEVEGAEITAKIAHVPQNEACLDTELLCLGAREIDHGRAQVEPGIGIASPVPLLQVGCRASTQFEHPVDSGFGEFPDRSFEEIDLAAWIARSQSNFVIVRVLIGLHRAVPGEAVSLFFPDFTANCLSSPAEILGFLPTDGRNNSKTACCFSLFPLFSGSEWIECGISGPERSQRFFWVRSACC